MNPATLLLLIGLAFGVFMAVVTLTLHAWGIPLIVPAGILVARRVDPIVARVREGRR